MKTALDIFETLDRLNKKEASADKIAVAACMLCDFFGAEIRAALAPAPPQADTPIKATQYHKFEIGDRVTKVKGSRWTGRVVGYYSTELTPIGYAVESETEKGSVQIYPEQALDHLQAIRPDIFGGK